jgi:glycosyltransferase involved in cell wall biosynthesis
VLYVRGYTGLTTYGAAAMAFLRGSRGWAKHYRIVHAHAGETAIVARMLTGRPVIASYCGDDLLGHARADGSFSMAHRLRRTLIQQHARLMSATITKSLEMELVMPARAARQNTVLPNGVDQRVFRPVPRDEARAKLGWPVNERVVLFAATRPHETRKRLDLAREAIALAQERTGSIRLYIAENVTPDDMPLLMNASDALLLTSQSEGSPNVVKEAVMCNLPVVSTDVGDVAEVLEPVWPSAVCSDAPADLAAALSSVLASGARSNGAAVREDLSHAAIAQRLLGLYARMGYTP